jgi:hypothetical protein
MPTQNSVAFVVVAVALDDHEVTELEEKLVDVLSVGDVVASPDTSYTAAQRPPLPAD